MSIITEQNCPTLRFLKWKQPLTQHPLFVRWKNDRRENSPLPYLHFTYPSKVLAIACKECVESWNYISDEFRSDIWTTSIAFGKAFESAADSICRHRVELYKEMAGVTYAGTAIHATNEAPICFLYSLKLINAQTEIRDGVHGIHVQWSGVILMVSGSELLAAAYCAERHSKVFSDASPKVKAIFEHANGTVDAALIFEVMDQLVFRKYANVTVRDAREKVKKDKNDTDKANELIIKTTLSEQVFRYDINWFTETRSAGFARKGFLGFRWKGPKGHQHRELVPVKATWVKGYTRKVRKPTTDFTLKDLEQAVAS